MLRTLQIAVAAFAGSLVIAAIGAAAPAPKIVRATVGPDFTINLTLGGKKVTALKKGVSYRLVINDRSSIHDFHLTGPGLNRVLTSVGFTGTKSVVLTLKQGTYRFVCDPHSDSMHGSFVVA